MCRRQEYTFAMNFIGHLPFELVKLIIVDSAAVWCLLACTCSRYNNYTKTPEGDGVAMHQWGTVTVATNGPELVVKKLGRFLHSLDGPAIKYGRYAVINIEYGTLTAISYPFLPWYPYANILHFINGRVQDDVDIMSLAAEIFRAGEIFGCGLTGAIIAALVGSAEYICCAGVRDAKILQILGTIVIASDCMARSQQNIHAAIAFLRLALK